jgi:hypothetical protein
LEKVRDTPFDPDKHTSQVKAAIARFVYDD